MINYPFAAVLFDLDGVVIDTTALHYRVWNEFAKRHGHVPSQIELVATNGRRAAETIRNWLGRELGDAEVDALTFERETQFNRALAVEPVDAVPGVREFIVSLTRRGVPIAVVTSAIPANADLSLARVGLAGRFDAMVSSADVRKGKPDPECYLKAAQLLGVKANRCVVIEDSISGIQAAKAAGTRCAALTTTFPRDVLEMENPDWLSNDFRDLALGLRV